MLHPAPPQTGKGALGVTTAIVDWYQPGNQLLFGEQDPARVTIGIEDEQFDRAVASPVGVSDGH
jgi:hypothetical protein